MLVEKKELGLLNELMGELQASGCDLRSRNVPTGGGDYDIEWHVIEHYMAKPTERERGHGRTILEALMDAFCRS